MHPIPGGLGPICFDGNVRYVLFTSRKVKLMTRRSHPPVMAAGVIHRQRGEYTEVLICKRADEPYAGKWCFPSGPAVEGEMPEAALRRALRTNLGIHVHIRIGQPPFDQMWDDVVCRWRFFFCDDLGDSIERSTYAEVRWVHQVDLREYEFDPVSQQVADWILEDVS